MAPLVHRPAEAAELLGCTEWWLRDKARRREIPFTTVGGAYGFTRAHLDRIVELFEVDIEPKATTGPVRRKPAAAPAPQSGVVQLQARPPKRRRAAS